MKAMLNIAICDDEQKYIDILSTSLDKYMIRNKTQYTVERFLSGLELLSSDFSNFDIVFLDVQMEVVNGIAVAEKIKNENETVIIFFVSALLQYACEGYKVGVERYLLKSSIDSDFDECMDYALPKIQANKDVLEIRFNSASAYIPLQTIIYIESKSRKLIIYTNKPETPQYECYDTIQSVNDKLHGKGFIRCHQSFLVNCEYIMNIRGFEFVLKNHETVPISKNKLQEVKKQYALIVG